MTAHAKKETPAFFSRSVAAPEATSAAMREVRSCRLVTSQPVGAGGENPASGPFHSFVRSSRTGNNGNIIATCRFAVNAVRREIAIYWAVGK